MHTIDLRARAPEIRPALPRLGGTSPRGDSIAFTNAFMSRNGEPWLAVSGEYHYSRAPRASWREEILRMKALGVDVISTYVFWIHHEEEEGVFDWSGDRDLRCFIELCTAAGVYAIVRIGPFCHGEVRNGGMPDWLYGRPFPLRSSDERYLAYVRRLYREIGRQLEGLSFGEGGPVIGIQIENELMHAGAPWETTPRYCLEWVPAGSGGVEHMLELKRTAIEAGIRSPLYTCTAWGGAPVPEGEFLPLYGGYAYCPWNVTESTPTHAPTREYVFRDFHRSGLRYDVFDPAYDPAAYPFACCEMGGGMQCWYRYRFRVEAEGVEAMAVVKLAGGCSMLGYYMFHGGSNPVGRHGYLNEHVVPRISYDFQAPLGEYGQCRESARRLRRLHCFCRCFGRDLAPMTTVLPEGAASVEPTDVATLRIAARVSGDAGFLFLNNYQDHVLTRDHEGVAVELELERGRVRLPSTGGFTLRSGACAIMPFGMEIGGARLSSATAQPIARIQAGGVEHSFFFAHDGIPAEYCFPTGEVASLDDAGGARRRGDGLTILRPQAGKRSVFCIPGRGGRAAIHTLTEQESLRFHLLDLWGAPRAVICEAEAYADAGELRLRIRSGAEEAVPLLVLPSPGAVLEAGGRRLEATAEGDFGRYEVPVPRARAGLSSRTEGGEAEITLAREAFEGVKELYLSISYEGDVGSAFIDGILVADNFANGDPWEIGLGRLETAVIAKGMYIHVTPRREGTVVIHEAGMARREEPMGREVATIRSIDAYAVHEIAVTAGAG